MKTPHGAIMAALFDSERAYADGATPLRKIRIPVEADTAIGKIESLAPGHYAIRSFHDLDGSGKLEFNFLGIPKQPTAFSNNAAHRMSAPSWSAAAFEITGGETAQSISID